MAKTASDTIVLQIYYTRVVNRAHQPDLLHACSKSNQWALQQLSSLCTTLLALHCEDISVDIRGEQSPDHTCCGQSYATSTQQHRIYAVSCHHQIHGKGGFPDKY